MSWSIGEIVALCTKAARGAGAPWAVAHEYGWAVRWLSRAGLPGADIALAVLECGPGRCPVALGLEIADSADLGRLEGTGIVREPVMLLAFLARTVPTGGAILLDVGGEEVHLSRAAMNISHRLAPAEIRYLGAAEPSNAPGPFLRVDDLPAATREGLEALASRTYAPSTEHSRLTGAGAGTIDTD